MNRLIRASVLPIATIVVVMSGCGSTKGRVATEQLLASDAVDRAVAQIDFRPLSGQKVFLDTQYIADDARTRGRSIGYVDSDYVISTLRQQIVAAGCLMEDRLDDANFVIEARVGALGTDQREMVYGLPASNALSAAASAAAAFSPTTAPIPTIPEISVARREDQSAAAKVSCFAYHRESRQPVWQSGLAVARSDAKDTYILGAGPFQKGSIYDGVQFAGGGLKANLLVGFDSETEETIALSEAHLFTPAGTLEVPSGSVSGVIQAGHAEVQPRCDHEPDCPTTLVMPAK